MQSLIGRLINYSLLDESVRTLISKKNHTVIGTVVKTEIKMSSSEDIQMLVWYFNKE